MSELNNKNCTQESGASSTSANKATPQNIQAFEQASFTTPPSMPTSSIPYSDLHGSLPEALCPGRHHVHHSYIWLGSLRAASSIILAIAIAALSSLISILFDADASEAAFLSVIMPFVIGGIVLTVLFIVGLIYLFQWLSWKHLTYELESNEFNLHSGIISKKHMHVPYQRVQAVNQKAGLLHRLVGVCDVKIDTAGGASNESITLRYMRTSEAEALRSELFRRKKVLLAGGSITEDGSATLDGTLYYSAWAIVSMGIAPQFTLMTALGYVLQPLPNASTVTANTKAATSETEQFRPYEGNVLDMADEIFQDVRGVFGGTEVNTGQVSFETGLSNKELLLAGASGAGEGLGLLFVGIVAVVGSVAQFFEGVLERWTEEFAMSFIEDSGIVALSGPSTLSSLANGAVLHIIVGALLVIVVLWLISALGTVVHYGGFRLRRREDRVEVESGLLSRSFHGVDVDRIQSVVIKQSFIRRLVGYCELSVLKIDSAAADAANTQSQQQLTSKGIVIHPFVKLSQVPQIIGGVLPEFADMPQETYTPAPIALRRGIIRMGIIQSAAFWFAVVVVFCQMAMELAIQNIPLGAEGLATLSIMRIVMMSYYALFALIFIVNVVNAVLWYRHSGLGYDRSFMSICNGGLNMTTTYTPRKKIQYAFLRTNPLQRRAHVASINVRTAAGIKGRTETLWDISEVDAEAWMEWVRPRSRVATNEGGVAIPDEQAGA